MSSDPVPKTVQFLRSIHPVNKFNSLRSRRPGNSTFKKASKNNQEVGVFTYEVVSQAQGIYKNILNIQVNIQTSEYRELKILLRFSRFKCHKFRILQATEFAARRTRFNITSPKFQSYAFKASSRHLGHGTRRKFL